MRTPRWSTMPSPSWPGEGSTISAWFAFKSLVANTSPSACWESTQIWVDYTHTHRHTQINTHVSHTHTSACLHMQIVYVQRSVFLFFRRHLNVQIPGLQKLKTPKWKSNGLDSVRCMARIIGVEAEQSEWISACKAIKMKKNDEQV